MSLITDILEQYYDLTHAADVNYQLIKALQATPTIAEIYRQHPHILAADAMLAVQYHIIKNVAGDIQSFLNARILLTRHMFASVSRATPEMRAYASITGKALHLISDCYYETFMAYTALLAKYHARLETLQQQGGFSHFDIIDLLDHYIDKLEKAGFSKSAILHACQNAAQDHETLPAMQIPSLSSLINMDKDFRKLVHAGPTLPPLDQCAQLTTLLKSHFPNTDFPVQLSRRLPHVLSASVGQQTASIWNTPTPPASAPPVLQPNSGMTRSV